LHSYAGGGTGSAMVHVKICGVTRVEDALMAVAAGADAIGLNFYGQSPRFVPTHVAKAVVDAVGDAALVVGVFVDADVDIASGIQREVGFRCFQFHGSEDPQTVARFLPHAYKALRVRGPEIVEEVRRSPGDHVLLDAYVRGQPGGTGATFDWALAANIARERKLTLAGGLTPDNVGDAVRAVDPFCVDVASGVESAPGVKDAALVRRFVLEAHDAFHKAL
jgi:phosphoribosylanthranilate isomerase